MKNTNEIKPNSELMTAREFERSNTIIWGALMAGCVLIAIVLSMMEIDSPEFYNLDNFYRSPFMWVSSVIALGGYFLGNLMYQKKAEEGAQLSSLSEKVNAFRSSFILKAALLNGPTMIAILFMLFDRNVYFLGIASILLIAQYLNRPTNERFFNDFKVNSSQRQEFQSRIQVANSNKNNDIRTVNTVREPPKASKWLLMLLALLIGLGVTSVYTLKADHYGILVKGFGGEVMAQNIYQPGIQVIAPWDKLIVYDTRIRESTKTIKAESIDGKELSIDLSYRYQPIIDKIGYLHQEIGPDYGSKFVHPAIKAITSEVIGSYRMEDILSIKREKVINNISFMARDSLRSNYIHLDKMVMNSIQASEK